MAKKPEKRGHNEGSIEKRDGRFRLRYRVNGKKQSETMAPGTTMKEARAKLTSLTDAANKGTAVENNQMTVTQWIDQWLLVGAPGSRLKKIVSERTKDRYRELLDTHVKPEIGDKKIQKLTSTDIDALYTAIRTKVSGKTKRVLSATTQHHIHIVLGAAINAAIRKKILHTNPIKDADVVPKADPRDGIALDEEQLGKLIVGFRNKSPALYPLIALVASTGLRRNEALALRWTDLDADKNTLRIERAWEPTKAHGLQLKDPKTKLGKRTIDLNAATVAMLVNHRAMYQRIVAGVPEGTDVDLALVRLPKDALMFPADPLGSKDIDFDKPRDPRNTTKEFRRVATLLGFPEFWFHNMRHTHATHLLDRGVPVHRVAKRIGEDAATLLKVYAKLTKNKNDAMVDAVNALGTNVLAP